MRIEDHPILKFERKEKISFTFEGQEMTGFSGETIAAALHANGVKELRHDKRPRGFFCAIGNCSSCLMEVDGVYNVRVCVEPLRAGMCVNRQKGHGDILAYDKCRGGEE